MQEDFPVIGEGSLLAVTTEVVQPFRIPSAIHVIRCLASSEASVTGTGTQYDPENARSGYASTPTKAKILRSDGGEAAIRLFSGGSKRACRDLGPVAAE